jgi:hypothetical protein
MQAPVRPTRARASGGRTLILLGVLLALAAGAIVIYIVSSAGGGPLSSTVTVVVANQDLPAGSVLSTTQNGTVAGVTFIPISAAFVTKSVNSDFAPKDSYIFKSQNDLNTLLNGEVVASNFYAGEILRVQDKRLLAAGAGAPGSLTGDNPGKLSTGAVLAQIPLSAKPAVVAGDSVNLIATFCNLPNRPNKCETQTTLKNLYIYAVVGNTVFVVVQSQDALNTLYISTSATNYELVIRKPGDTTNPTTTPVDGNSIARDFGY